MGTGEPKLAQNSRGKWEIRWSENGRSMRKSTRTADETQAQQVFLQWQKSLSGEEAVRTVVEALRAYERHIKDRAGPAATVVSMVPVVNRLTGSTPLLALAVSDLRQQDVDRYTAHRRRAGVKDSTVRKELGMLRAALNYCHKAQLLTCDVPYFELPKAQKPKEHWLTREQVDTLLAWFTRKDPDCQLRSHRFVVLALATGARKRALERLTWQQVDTVGGLVRFDLQESQYGRKRKVAVPIADWLQPYLRSMVQGAMGDYVLDDDSDIRNAFDWAMKKAARETGEQAFASLTRHALRHTFATLSLQAGCSVWAVASMLGNTPEMVAKVYGHHCPDYLREVANSWKTEENHNG